MITSSWIPMNQLCSVTNNHVNIGNNCLCNYYVGKPPSQLKTPVEQSRKSRSSDLYISIQFNLIPRYLTVVCMARLVSVSTSEPVKPDSEGEMHSSPQVSCGGFKPRYGILCQRFHVTGYKLIINPFVSLGWHDIIHTFFSWGGEPYWYQGDLGTRPILVQGSFRKLSVVDPAGGQPQKKKAAMECFYLMAISSMFSIRTSQEQMCQFDDNMIRHAGRLSAEREATRAGSCREEIVTDTTLRMRS